MQNASWPRSEYAINCMCWLSLLQAVGLSDWCLKKSISTHLCSSQEAQVLMWISRVLSLFWDNDDLEVIIEDENLLAPISARRFPSTPKRIQMIATLECIAENSSSYSRDAFLNFCLFSLMISGWWTSLQPSPSHEKNRNWSSTRGTGAHETS